MIKGTGKRMVPERDIKYLEDLKANHSDPTASWGGTEVVANPTPGVDDPALTGLQVGDNKYKVPEVSNVVANPTLTGTEPVLTGLQVGDNKYSIPEGGGSSPELYLHTINLIIRPGSLAFEWVFAQICIINDSNTSMNYNSIYNYLNTNGFVVTRLGAYGEDSDTSMNGKVYTLGVAGNPSTSGTVTNCGNCMFIYNNNLCFGFTNRFGVGSYESLNGATVTDTKVRIL